MNSREFQKQLTSAIPDVPEHFHNRMEMTLASIVNQEANMKESTKKAIRTAGRFSSRTVALALALMMAVSAVALAATQWHVFDNLSFLTIKSHTILRRMILRHGKLPYPRFRFQCVLFC